MLSNLTWILRVHRRESNTAAISRLIEEPGEISRGFRVGGFCRIRSGFRSEEDRKAITALARRFSTCRVTRRAALVLLDKGECRQAAHAPLLDDATIRGRRKLFERRGIEGIASFDVC
jgi:hypothetical protein